MNYSIRMGIPEMEELWSSLQAKFRSGTIGKTELQLYKKWGSALKKLSEDPFYPSLKTHEIAPLSRRYGMRVWQSYLENRNSRPDYAVDFNVSDGNCEVGLCTCPEMDFCDARGKSF